MAQLELASLLAATPANGLTGATGSPLSAEAGAETTDTAPSFSQLLAGSAQTPAAPLAPGQLAGELAAGSTINNLPPPVPTPASNDPASLGQAVQLLAPAALAEGLVPTADGVASGESGESGESGKSDELSSEAIDAPSGDHAAEAAWLGWPLFLESRAALRDSSALGTEHLPSPPAEAALVDNTLEGIHSSSAKLAPWTQWTESSAGQTNPLENAPPALIQQTLITDDQGQRAATKMMEPMLAASSRVDSLVSAAPTKAILTGLPPAPLPEQTAPSLSATLRAADLAIDLRQAAPPHTEPAHHQSIPDPNGLAIPPAAASTSPASTSALSGSHRASSIPLPSSADLTATIKAATLEPSPASAMAVNAVTAPITAAVETVLARPITLVTSQPATELAASDERIDWQRRLAQSLARTRQPGTAPQPNPPGDSLKSLSAVAKASLDAADTETGTDSTAVRPPITSHGSQTEAKPAAGTGLQRHPLFAIPVAPSRDPLFTEEPTPTSTSTAMDTKMPWESTTTSNKRGQTSDLSPVVADPEPVASMPLETRWNSSATATASVTTPERAADNGITTRTAESTPTAAVPLTRVDSSTATSPRPAASSVPTPLPTAPETLDLQQKNWERTLARQLDWAVSNRFQEAEIKVNPPDLGPLEMRLTLHHNQTSVMFFSHEAAVREALETALPRLRELLDSQGITLNQAQVSDQSLARHQAGAGEQSGYGQRERNRTPSPSDTEVPAETAQPRSRSRGLRGAVDDYA